MMLRVCTSGLQQQKSLAHSLRAAPAQHVDPPGVKNFHESWKNGMAFCALIHKHKPGMIDYASLDPNDHAGNLEKAFAAAESLGIMRFLDVEDMVENERPDEKSVMTYLFQWYKYFAAGNKSETAARRIAKLVALTKQLNALKEEYNVRSAAWAAWTSAKTAELNAMEPANSIEGVKQTLAIFKEYKSNEKPPKAGEKTEIELLLNNIQLKLKNADRPAFVPEHSAADIASLWKALLAAEQQTGTALKSELKRQQTLLDLVKRFNRLDSKLKQFASEKNAYLDNAENIDTLNAAEAKLQLHQGFFVDLADADKTLSRAQDLANKIGELNYAEKDDVAARAAALAANSQALKSSGDAKQQRLEEAVAREQRKNELRKEFAAVAKDAKDSYKNQTISISTSGFGHTLAAVTAFKATLDEDAARITGEANAQRDAVVSKDAELTAAGITSNEYTVITVADITAAHEALEQKLATRSANYDAELAHQTALDNKRREFAAAAQALNDFLAEQQAAIDTSEGSEDEKIAATKALMAKGSDASTQLDSIKAIDAEIKGMLSGTANEHSAFTVDDLSRMLSTFNSKAQNQIDTCEENKHYAARTAEQEAAAAARGAAEKASVDFATLASQVANWLATVQDNIGEDVSDVTSMDAVDVQLAQFNQSNGELADFQAKFDKLSADAAAMTASGNNDFGALSLADVQAKWDTTTAALGARAAALDEARVKQAADEALRVAFVAAITDVNDFLQQQKTAVAGEASGELEQQLEDANNLMVVRNTTGMEKMQAVEAANNAMGEAHVSADDKTDLSPEGVSAEFEQLGDAIKAKIGAVQAEIASKASSEIPAEKVTEFREVFAHFDKNSNGVLSHLEFTGCLKSLGEDRSDADFAQICQNVDTDGDGEIQFKEFLEFMISVTQDKDTEDEIVAAFRVITNDGDVISEDQVRSCMEAETADYLIAQMPAVEGGFDYKSWTAQAYGR